MKKMALSLRGIITFLFVLTLQFGDFMLSYSGRRLAINNFLYILIILISVFYVACHRIKISAEDKVFILYWAYAFLMTLICVAGMGLEIPIEYIYHVAYMLLVVVFVRKSLYSEQLFWRMLYFMSICQCFLLIYQEISRISSGYFVKFVSYAQDDRPAALFSEPAHFCMLICFVLCSVLFHVDNLQIEDKIRFPLSIFFSIVAIVSVSSSGLVYVSFIWGAWFLVEKKVNKKKFFMIVLVLSILIYLVTQTDWLLRAFNHLTETNFKRTTSGSFRIMRGFDLYSRQGFVQKLFGFGAGNTADVIRSTGFISIYDHMGNYHNVYVSALSSFFLETGIIGVIIFAWYWFKIGKRANRIIGVLGVLYLLYILSNEIVYTPQIVVILFIINVEKDRIKQNKRSMTSPSYNTLLQL